MMKTLLLALALLCPVWAMATPRSINVEWGYTTPSEPAVTGFRLYQEGVAVHDWSGQDVRVGDATVDVTAQITNFTLTATFAPGTWTQASCSDTQYTDQSTCETATETWTSASCSYPTLETEEDCTTTESPHSALFAFNPMAPTTIKFVWLKHGNKAVPMIKPQGVRLR